MIDLFLSDRIRSIPSLSISMSASLLHVISHNTSSSIIQGQKDFLLSAKLSSAPFTVLQKLSNLQIGPKFYKKNLEQKDKKQSLPVLLSMKQRVVSDPRAGPATSLATLRRSTRARQVPARLRD
jgi:hypothetical protein